MADPIILVTREDLYSFLGNHKLVKAFENVFQGIGLLPEAIQIANAAQATADSKVSSLSVAAANGISGSFTPTTTPQLTLSLGNITPLSVSAAGVITGLNLSGVNTGDQVDAVNGPAGAADNALASFDGVTGKLIKSGVYGQIKFPAVQAPSFDPNTLDDYEEGTWTPGLSFGGGAAGIAYSVQTGTYIKIGRLVSLSFVLTLTSKGSSTGNAQITGLPFTTSASPNYSGGVAAFTMTGLTSSVGLGSSPSSLLANVFHTGATGIANLTNANFNNTSQINGTLTYQASA